MIRGERVFVICEAGVTNYGELELALRQVDAAVDAGADAVKFQAWVTEELVSRPAAAAARDELGYDWFERMEERRLSHDDLRRVGEYAGERGITFFASAHDERSLEFLAEELDVPLLKVGSGEAANERFLRAVGSARKPTLISFGLQSTEEAKHSVEILRDAGAPEVVPLHCVTLYPTPYELARLDRIAALRDALGDPVGISDHTVGRHVVLAAVALGARVVEKHLTFDREDPRSLDNPGALEPADFAALVREIRELEEALRPVDDATFDDALTGSRAWAAQAVVAARPLEAGTALAEADLAFKRPAWGGIPAAEAGRIVGRTLRRDVREDEQIREDDLGP
jgi:N,N'-diacetyllegionaminate synthase